jgi:hypothetical protein
VTVFNKKQRFRTGPRSAPWNGRRGFPWLTPESHARLLDVMVKPHDIPWTFERWQEQAENRERIWKSRNYLAVRVKIDPDAFIEWCAAGSQPPNGQMLELFANMAVNMPEGRP